MVQISTSIKHTVTYLNYDTSRSSYGLDLYCAALALYVFLVYHLESSETNSGQSYWPQVEQEFEMLLWHITGQTEEPMDPVTDGDASAPTALLLYLINFVQPSPSLGKLGQHHQSISSGGPVD
ncbi:hypothetical protein H4R33_007168 [Dimargaris cristalligena]|nr:hypothetical protein H4R33_007168 [Dimargaris cristalligena]